MLDDDPDAKKEMAGFYSRKSIKSFDDAIADFLVTQKANPIQIIADAADVSHPNGTDAWTAARDSLNRRGDALVSASKSSRNLNLLVFLLATGLSLCLALLVARSISKPLISVAEQSERMSTETLPNAVRGVLNTPVGHEVVEPTLPPIEVQSRDEVALVASAINDLQDRTIGLAVEQAVQRTELRRHVPQPGAPRPRVSSATNSISSPSWRTARRTRIRSPTCSAWTTSRPRFAATPSRWWCWPASPSGASRRCTDDGRRRAALRAQRGRELRQGRHRSGRRCPGLRDHRCRPLAHPRRAHRQRAQVLRRELHGWR